MTASPPDPRPAPELANVATVTTYQATVVSFGLTVCFDDYRSGSLSLRRTGVLVGRRNGKTGIVTEGLRHGRLGFGLGGGIS